MGEPRWRVCKDELQARWASNGYLKMVLTVVPSSFPLLFLHSPHSLRSRPLIALVTLPESLLSAPAFTPHATNPQDQNLRLLSLRHAPPPPRSLPQFHCATSGIRTRRVPLIRRDGSSGTRDGTSRCRGLGVHCCVGCECARRGTGEFSWRFEGKDFTHCYLG